MSAADADHGKLRDETPTTFYESAVRIPGFRTPPERCRGFTPVGVCDHGHAILGRSSCGTRYCPEHWRDWCQDAVANMVARLAAYRWSREGAERRLSHVVASPPQDRRYSVRELWETRSDAYDVLEAAGVDGGAVVTHPYRTTDEADRLHAIAAEHGDATGKWSFLRDVADDWDELAELVKAEPHYHALAAGEDIRGQDAPDGWVVERIRTVKPFHHIRDSEAYEAMIAPAYYILTHAAEQQGRQTVTYFGDVHPAAFDPAEELTTAEWERIQIEAEAAVSPDDGTGEETPECPRDDCEAVVYDVAHLPELMEDDDWVARIKSGRHGKARYDRLKGVLLWWEGRCDTPPPSAHRSERRLLDWLEERGSVHTPNPKQASLSKSITGEHNPRFLTGLE